MKPDDLDRLLAADAPEPSDGFDARVSAALAAVDAPTLDDLLDADRPAPGPDFDDRVLAALAAADRPTLDDLLDADRPDPSPGFDARVDAALKQAESEASASAPQGGRILRFPTRRTWPVIGAVIALAAALALWVMPGPQRDPAQPGAADIAFLDEMDLLEVYDEMQVFDGITDDETFELVAALHTLDDAEALP